MKDQHRKVETADAGDALRQYDRLLDLIVRVSPIPQFVIDAEHRIIHWNIALENYTGIKAEEVIGTNHHWKAFYSEERPCMADLLVDGAEDLISECYPGKYEKSALVKGAYEATDFFPKIRGIGAWLYFTASLIRDDTGRTIGALETLEDISRRKLAEEALKKSEEKFRNVFDWANDAILLHNLTHRERPGRFIEANRVACEMLGYSREELFNMGPTDIVPWELHPQLAEILSEAEEKNAFIFETRLLRNDGTTFPAESSCHLVDYDGDRIWISHIRDISLRRQSQEDLWESEKKFRYLVENINDVIFTLDLNGKFTYVSPVVEKMYGFKSQEVEGRHFFYFVHPDDRQNAIEAFRHRVAGEYGENMFRIIAKDGRECYVRTTMTPLMKGKKIAGFNYVMTDITKRRKAEEALRQANRKLNMLSSITRHDILNQIMGIKGYLELSKNIAEEPRLKEYIEMENQAVDSIRQQIEFTRYYQDIGVEEPKWQDVGEVIDKVAGSLAVSGIGVKNSIDGLEIFVDPLIEKVFYNLMENSLRHGGHVTEICLSCSENDDMMVISYRDNGIGITEEEKKDLFRKGHGKHTGLGLFLSREILSITGITMREAGEPGKGVNFEIVVPKGSYRRKDR